jgi:RNA polymerase sigma-70 factor (ECF subfamily)
MMFSCCHPLLSEEAQVALILNVLCAFSIDEVAGAFVSSHAAIEKRISRAKKVLAGSKKLFDIAMPADCSARLPAVQRALYLLFNEGYHGASPDSAIRAELCHEAMRLAAALLDHSLGATPATYALSALMCLDAARLPARVSEGNLRSLFDQDRSLWDRQLVTEGLKLLEMAATGSELTTYHVEAAIASVHASAARPEDTDWTAIVSLYDTLLSLRPSPIIALNRAIALAQRDGAARGLEAINAIADRDRLAAYPFYHAALGELGLRLRRAAFAGEHFRAALALARNPMERAFLDRRARACTQHELPQVGFEEFSHEDALTTCLQNEN